MVGHVSPEAGVGGPLAVVQDGDRITIDLDARTLDIAADDAELTDRLTGWTSLPPRYGSGVLAIYARLVSSASLGAVTE